MDLLGGYGSDDESSEDEMMSTAEAPMPPPPKRAKPAAIISKRGKKLVSLHAVLPPHILEQLTNGADDSDDDDGHVTKTTTEMKSKQTTTRGADEGLTSLLSELGAVQKTMVKSTTKSYSKSEKMGEAFLQTRTTVLSKTKTYDAGICKPVQVETINNEDDGEDRVETAPWNVAVPVKRPLAPALRRQAISINVPRPPSFQPAPPPTYGQPQSSDAVRPSSCNTTEAEAKPQDAPTNQRVEKKRSRREMEKALRSGNLTAIDGQAGIHTLDSDANIYVPQEESLSAPKGSGVRVAPVAMYDTKAGKDVVGSSVSGKARGKNQINHLMVSAAAFEANQAQQAKLKTNRANARSKYGW